MMAQPIIIPSPGRWSQEDQKFKIWGQLGLLHRALSHPPLMKSSMHIVLVFCFSDNWCCLGTFLDSKAHFHVYTKVYNTMTEEEQASFYNKGLLWQTCRKLAADLPVWSVLYQGLVCTLPEGFHQQWSKMSVQLLLLIVCFFYSVMS